MVPRRKYELELAPAEINLELFHELERLAPFGQGNAQPLIRVGPLRLRATPRLFGNGHLGALAIGADGGRVEILGWGWAERQESLQGEFELLAHLERDRRHGGLVLRGVDVRASG